MPTFMGKKRFMAQSLPLEIFADRKIKKWQTRATARGIRLVDGVGASPISEMIYIWSKLNLLSQQWSDLTASRWVQADGFGELRDFSEGD